MGNRPPVKLLIVTPKNFNFKLCTRDKAYVGETTHHANFGFNRYIGGFFPNKRNIQMLIEKYGLSCRLELEMTC